MRWSLLGLAVAPGCTIVLSSTPCDTGGGPLPDSGDTGVVDVPRTATALSAGGHHACAADESGAVQCWGFDGDLGVATAPDGLEFPTALSAGYLFTCALSGDDASTPTCWGDDSAGQLTPGGAFAPPLAAGGAHACALADGGGVACWGRGSEGQSTPPAAIAAAPSVTLLASGWLFSCAQESAADAPACWGWDASGQVSDAPTDPLSALALGQGFGVGVRATDGQLTCWGRVDVCDALPPPTGDTWSAVTAGLDFACGTTTDGTAACWGINTNGVLDGVPTDPVESVSAGPGGRHACAILADGSGTVACWGLDASGQSSP